MTVVIAFLMCTSAAVFFAHALNAYHENQASRSEAR